MYVVCVTVTVLPGRGEEFLEATMRNYRATRQEPGNIRFDILQLAATPPPGEPEGFFLYEAYCSADDFAAHQQTPHYLQWREAVAPLMAAPRQSERYQAVFPDLWGEDAVGESQEAPVTREMIVFISYENGGSPEAVGREMAQALEIDAAEFGVDMFTGGCEIRLAYDEALLDKIRDWLQNRGIVHDISFVGG